MHQSSTQPSAVSNEQQQAVARIAGAVAHELNNPLQGILSLIGVTIQECRMDERCQARLEQIRHGVTRLSRTVESLSAIYENLPRSPDPFPLNDLLYSIGSSLVEQGFRVRTDADVDAHLVVALAPEIQRLITALFREHTDAAAAVNVTAVVSGPDAELRCEAGAASGEQRRDDWQRLANLSGVSGLAVLMDEIATLSGGSVEFRWRDSALQGIRIRLRLA